MYLVSVSALSALESTKIELAAPAPTPEPTEEPASEPEAAAPEEDAETTSSPASDAAPEADAFFPDLLEQPQWKIRQESNFMEYEGLSYQYVEYVNES